MKFMCAWVLSLKLGYARYLYNVMLICLNHGFIVQHSQYTVM